MSELVPDFKNRRRFQRVIIKGMEGDLSSLLGAEMAWANGEKTGIYDISYGGLAAAKPKQVSLSIGASLVGEVELSGKAPIRLTGEVAWFNDAIVGLSFAPLNIVARKTINDFLDDKMIGANLHLIHPQYYGPQMDCNYWFQSLRGVNLYIWVRNQKILKARVEFDESWLNYESGKIELMGRSGESKDLVQRTIEILSQVEPEKDLLKQLLKDIVQGSKSKENQHG